MKKFVTFFVSLLLISANLTAQNYIPQAFSYQCVVRDGAGNPMANQTVVLLMNIRSGAANGPVAFSEMHTISTNEYGLINTAVGQGTPLQGDFAAINWSGGSKYLEVSLETSPGTFDVLGSTQLLSVPYAQYALTSGSGGGGAGDNWGAQSVQTNTTLNGNGTLFNPLKIAQNGAATGQVLKWDGAEWIPQDDISNTGTNGGTVTQISTGAGLTGGPITTSGTISLSNSGVNPGIYGSATQIPVITVDAQGRITSIFTQIVQPGTVGIIGSNGINVQQQGTTFTLTNTGDTNAFDDVLVTAQANGDISGTFGNLQIKPDAVSSLEIDNGTIIGNDINSMDAAVGQVLKWTGSNWVPQNDLSGISAVSLNEGTGIDISGASPNFTITNTGDPDATDDLTVNSAASGDVSGVFSNLQITGGAVGVTELANQAVTASKLDDMGASNGQVLKWNGLVWSPSNDNVGTTTISAGAGMVVTGGSGNYTVINAGDVDPDDDIALTSIANGDVTGTFTNLQLKTGIVQTANVEDAAITGVKLSNMGAASGQALKWNGAEWAPADDLTGGTGGSNTYAAGAGIAITGTAPNLTIENTGDLSTINELQSLSLVGNTLSLSNGGGSVTLPSTGGNSYTQGFGISITGAAPNFTIANTGDGDNNPNNELQNLSLAGTTLSISNGNSVDLSGISGGGVGQWVASGTAIYNANSGNVGIGTSTPVHKLDINGDSRLRFNSASATPQLTLEETELDYARIGFKNTGASGSWLMGGRGASVGLNGDFGLSFLKSGPGGGLVRIFSATSDGKFGINTSDPTATLHLVGDDLAAKIQGNNPRLGFFGTQAGADAAPQKGYLWQQGNHLDLGSSMDTVSIRLTPGNAPALSATSAGNIGIGTTNPGSYKLQVLHDDYGLNLQNQQNNHRWELWTSDNDGSLVLFNDQLPPNTAAGFFAANGAYTSSDRRLKKDIADLPEVLNKVLRLHPVSYRLQYQQEMEQKTLGFIAQDVAELFPELVATADTRGTGPQYLAVNYAGFGVLAVKALQEQQLQLQLLKTENAELKSKIEDQDKRLQRLEALLEKK